MSDNQLKIGLLVEAIAYKGEILKRRVVEVRDGTIYICREDEWEKANEEGRESECIGFRQECIRPVKR